MTKWRIQAEFIFDVLDEDQARIGALNVLRGVAAAPGTSVITAGGQSPEVASYELASDPRAVASTLATAAVGEAVMHVSWLDISDVRTNTKPID